ncbi:MAG: bifunctional riboflavin kinase/FAD synthetase [Polynucleobacter sp.]|nr:MAG: bifunctional riboflavin kinase/FAD synthetase [Polynucleobacter sp.]
MKVIRGIPPAANWTPCALTIGNFDGVHRGHQALLKKLVATAKAQDLQSCVMTFEPHPIEYFAPEKAPSRILSLRDKLEALAKVGIDQVLVVHFNQHFANLSPEEFVKTILVQGLQVKSILIGDDFHYGAKRAGNFSSLQEAGKAEGFSVERMDTLMESNERISSSAIRTALEQGHLEKARQLLGRPYMLSGHVLHGQKLGRSLGFPTLNISLANKLHRRKPAAQGIFIAQVHGLSDNPLPAVASLGQRPTVDDSGRYLLEVHIFNFNQSVYGKLVQIELIEKIRDEEKYNDLEALQNAIWQDALAAKNYFEITDHV